MLNNGWKVRSDLRWCHYQFIFLVRACLLPLLLQPVLSFPVLCHYSWNPAMRYGVLAQPHVLWFSVQADGWPKFQIQAWCNSFQCFGTVGWASGRASSRYKLSDEVLVWLSVWSEMQIVCIRSSWCHFIPIIWWFLMSVCVVFFSSPLRWFWFCGFFLQFTFILVLVLWLFLQFTFTLVLVLCRKNERRRVRSVETEAQRTQQRSVNWHTWYVHYAIRTHTHTPV